MARQPTTIARLVADATVRIARSGSDTARLDAEILYRHAAVLDRNALFLALPDAPDPGAAARFEALVVRRLAGAPIAYLTGTREFTGLPFTVAPGVLVPRPETELLVEWALAALATEAEPVTVVDVGAGSGAIGIAAAALGPVRHRFLAIEPSAPARDIATRNADALLTGDRRARWAVTEGDLLDSVDAPVGMVLANLPYLTPAQIAENPMLNAEPRLALDGGADGLDLVRRLVAQLPDRLTPRAWVGLEIDPSQAATVRALLAEAIPVAEIDVIRDLAGHDRHVVAHRHG